MSLAFRCETLSKTALRLFQQESHFFPVTLTSSFCDCDKRCDLVRCHRNADGLCHSSQQKRHWQFCGKRLYFWKYPGFGAPQACIARPFQSGGRKHGAIPEPFWEYRCIPKLSSIRVSVPLMFTHILKDSKRVRHLPTAENEQSSSFLPFGMLSYTYGKGRGG